jgi:hypothetical protein
MSNSRLVFLELLPIEAGDERLALKRVLLGDGVGGRYNRWMKLERVEFEVVRRFGLKIDPKLLNWFLRLTHL